MLKITAYAQKLLDGLDTLDWPEKVKLMQRNWIGKSVDEHGVVTYQLRDWIFSRQRYWGEPIPLVHCAQCGVVPVPEAELPVRLPEVERYEPTGTGESPLAAIASWVNTTCPSCERPAQRETNTMPQWAGSCWYFLRYPDPACADTPWRQEDMHYWLPVDLYVGGIEHAILHLLYARFYVKVLYDLGYVPFDEPFAHLFNQGMVLKRSEKSGLVEKMSKSKGNVVSPDEMVERYGSDALRMYMVFMGPPELDCEWQDAGLEGMKRFLHRLWAYLTDPATLVPADQPEEQVTKKRFHKFLKEYQERLTQYKPNTALAACMEWLNDATTHGMRLNKTSCKDLLVSVSVIAPHMASELLELLVGVELADCAWPSYDAALAADEMITIAVQVNGKVRATLSVAPHASVETVQPHAEQAVAKWLTVGRVVKVVYVPQRLISFVVVP